MSQDRPASHSARGPVAVTAVFVAIAVTSSTLRVAEQEGSNALHPDQAGARAEQAEIERLKRQIEDLEELHRSRDAGCRFGFVRNPVDTPQPKKDLGRELERVKTAGSQRSVEELNELLQKIGTHCGAQPVE